MECVPLVVIVGVNVTIILSPTVSNAFSVTSVDVTGVSPIITVGVNVPLTPPVFLHVTFTVNIQVPSIQGPGPLSIVIVVASMCAGNNTQTSPQLAGGVGMMAGTDAVNVIEFPEFDILVIDMSLVVSLHNTEFGAVLALNERLFEDPG